MMKLAFVVNPACLCLFLLVADVEAQEGPRVAALKLEVMK